MNEEHTRTGRFKALAPGLAWIPRYIRDNLTPMLVSSAFTLIFTGISYVFNSPQKEIAGVQNSVTEIKQQLTEAIKLMHETQVEQAGMKTQLNTQTDELERQRDWREGIEREAETPPHARRRH